MGGTELVIVGAVLVVVLALPRLLPRLARSIVDGIGEFRRIGHDDPDDQPSP
jgi:Sec-independent protein translocase protein TatA